MTDSRHCKRCSPDSNVQQQLCGKCEADDRNAQMIAGASSPIGLRDYFAAHATEEDCKYAAQIWMEQNNAETCQRQVARFAHADAMLEARKLT